MEKTTKVIVAAVAVGAVHWAAKMYYPNFVVEPIVMGLVAGAAFFAVAKWWLK